MSTLQNLHQMLYCFLKKNNPNRVGTEVLIREQFRSSSESPFSGHEITDKGMLTHYEWPEAINGFVKGVKALDLQEVNQENEDGETLLDVAFESMLGRAGLYEVFENNDRTFLPTVKLIRPLMERNRIFPLHDLSQHIESGLGAAKYIDRALSFALYLIGAGADLPGTIQRALVRHSNGLALLETIADAMTLLYNGYYAMLDGEQFDEKKKSGPVDLIAARLESLTSK